MADPQDGRAPDPISRRILGELRDLRIEMRADRQRSDEERRRSDDRFETMMREFREDSARRENVTQKAFRDIRSVGLSIVKTLNRHTRILEHHGRILEHHGRILERIDGKLGRGNGLPGDGNGRRA